MTNLAIVQPARFVAAYLLGKQVFHDKQ